MKKSIAAFAIALIAHTSSYAGKFIISPEIGQDNINFGQEFTFSGAPENEASLSMNLRFGYRFASNFLVMANAGFSDSSGLPLFNLFGATTDTYQVSNLGIAAGYTINVGDRFRLVPMIGISSWGLKANEGQLFNPGPEEESSYDGSDTFSRLSAEMVLSDALMFNVSYAKYNYEFGDTDSVRAGFSLEF